MSERKPASRSGDTFRYLLMVSVPLALGLLVFLALSLVKADTRLAELERLRAGETAGWNYREDSLSRAELNSLSSRLSSLESLQEAIANTSRGAMDQMNMVFAIATGFFGFFALLLGFRQYVADGAKEDQEAKNLELLGSFHRNMGTITDLIETLNTSYRMQDETKKIVAEMTVRWRDVTESQDLAERNFKEVLASLNRDAVLLYRPGLDRVNLYDRDMTGKLRDFSHRLNNASTARDLKPYLNSFCFFSRGLGHLNEYRYQEAIADFETASHTGKVELAAGTFGAYAPEQRMQLVERIEDMLTSCCYFQGVSHKNLGNYREGGRRFLEAVARNPRHFHSKTYILQIRFFEQALPFQALEQEFEATREEFRALDGVEPSDGAFRRAVRRALHTLEIYQGNLYVAKQYLPGHKRAYQAFENQDTALKHYWEAFDLEENEVSSFHVAQAMEGAGASGYRGQSPQKMYEKAMRQLKNRTAEDLDHLYSVTLFYMLAICSRKLNPARDAFEAYLSQARNALKQVPSDVTCYSPVSKVRLERAAILEEMESFEKKP